MASAAPAQPAAPSYTDIVKLYRAGEFDAAVAALRAMPPEEVNAGVDAMLRAFQKAGGIEPVKAAAMLHTEAAIDERLQHRAVLPAQWATANALMRLFETMDPQSALVRQWRLLMTSFLQGQLDFFMAMDYARGTWKAITIRSGMISSAVPATSSSSGLPAGVLGVDDGELRLAVATIHEMLWQRDLDAGWSHPRGNLGAAAGELRRALELRPDLVEARVRLARVLTFDRKYEGAARVFADIGNVTEPRFKYLAGLFEGNLAERRGDAARAEACYLAAIDAAPAAQSARVALAHLRHATGNRGDAAARVRALASDPAGRDADDPWLWYLKGMSWRADGYLAELRTMIHPASAR
jgi:tetratricopeptide (TPR) repeat protein